MPREVTRKWRPPLALVIGGTLLAVLSLPILGVTWLRLAGNILGWAETGWLIGCIAVVATGVLAWLLWRLVLRPVWALTAHARAVEAGELDAVPPEQFGTAELSALGQSVAGMAESLDARARSLSAYADHVTHELKSPLTALRGAAEMLGDEALMPAQRKALLKTIDDASMRMTVLLDALRDHSAARLQAGKGTTRLLDALALADVPESLLVDIEADSLLPMPTPDLARVLTQLAQNAAAHGATLLTLQPTEFGFSAADNGPGIPVGDADRIFDPFFTTRREQGGTGMGLAIAQTLIEAAGGHISLIPHAAGACFKVAFGAKKH